MICTAIAIVAGVLLPLAGYVVVSVLLDQHFRRPYRHD